MLLEILQHNTVEGIKAAFTTWEGATSPATIESVQLSVGGTGQYLLTIIYT